MMDEGLGRDIAIKPNKDEVTKVSLPVDKDSFNRHMMSQRKFHAEALRDIENYLWTEGLITRRIAMAARER